MPDQNQPTEGIGYCGILFTPDAIRELDGRRTVTTVQRSAVITISLRYGFQARSPAVQTGCGLLLFAIGLFPVAGIIQWLQQGGTMLIEAIMLTLLILFGGWIIYDSLRRGYYLQIQEDNASRKLMFTRRAKLPEIRSFLHQVHHAFAYDIYTG